MGFPIWHFFVAKDAETYGNLTLGSSQPLEKALLSILGSGKLVSKAEFWKRVLRIFPLKWAFQAYWPAALSTRFLPVMVYVLPRCLLSSSWYNIAYKFPISLKKADFSKISMPSLLNAKCLSDIRKDLQVSNSMPHFCLSGPVWDKRGAPKVVTSNLDGPQTASTWR